MAKDATKTDTRINRYPWFLVAMFLGGVLGDAFSPKFSLSNRDRTAVDAIYRVTGASVGGMTFLLGSTVFGLWRRR